MSRSADLAAVSRARCISARAGSVDQAGGRESSCCNCWIRKVRPRRQRRLRGCQELGHVDVRDRTRCVRVPPALGWSEEPASDPPLLRKRGRELWKPRGGGR